MINGNIRLMQGNEACVEGALAAGMKFYAGYPITPSTEIAELCAQKLPSMGGRFIQMEDEIASMAAIIGGSLAGLKSMTATSGPGFSLMQENIGYAIITEIPCVVVNVQRYGPSTGLATTPAQGDIMQARWGTHGDHPAIALSPTSVKETYDLTIKAFNLSEKYRMPVFLILDEIIGHLREKVEIQDKEKIEIYNRLAPAKGDIDYRAYYVEEDEIVPRMAALGEGFKFHVTGLIHDESGFPSSNPEVAEKLLNRIMKKITDNIDDISMYDKEYMEDADIVVLAYGAIYRSAKSAVKQARRLGYKVGLFKPITLWPSPEKQIRNICKKVKKIIIPELNLGQYCLEVERIVFGQCKVHSISKVNGEIITPNEILAEIRKVV